jgi:hypothetical protein
VRELNEWYFRSGIIPQARQGPFSKGQHPTSKNNTFLQTFITDELSYQFFCIFTHRLKKCPQAKRTVGGRRQQT